jgi:hypothetical protein
VEGRRRPVQLLTWSAIIREVELLRRAHLDDVSGKTVTGGRRVRAACRYGGENDYFQGRAWV